MPCRVYERVSEDVEGALVVASVDAEALTSLLVGYGDDHAIIARAPKQSNVDAIVEAAVELVEGVGHGAPTVPSPRRPRNADQPADRIGSTRVAW
jgi:hypothetical protein